MQVIGLTYPKKKALEESQLFKLRKVALSPAGGGSASIIKIFQVGVDLTCLNKNVC
jgi:hypothetical protein